MPTSSQAFLRELDKKLWTSADKLRSTLDVAGYTLEPDAVNDLRVIGEFIGIIS